MRAIKMFAMLPRRPDLPAQAFHDHWRHPSGTVSILVQAERFLWAAGARLGRSS